jgi:hypothetical protein
MRTTEGKNPLACNNGVCHQFSCLAEGRTFFLINPFQEAYHLF